MLPSPLVVQVTDAAGQPVVGGAGGVPRDREQRRAGQRDGAAGLAGGEDQRAGQASAQLPLGTRAGVGNNVVEATATGFTGPAVFTALGDADGAAQQIVVDTGNGQIGRDRPGAAAAVHRASSPTRATTGWRRVR